MQLLRCESLDIGFSGRTVASGIGFSVSPGEGVCVVGANGTGKTTLLRTLAGILPPLAGTIAFDASIRPGDVGFLPQQNPVQGDFPATVREVVLSGCQALRGWRPFFSNEERDRAERSLARFGASGIASLPYRELSGGQRQRVLLARALCAGRRLLLLDEPVTGLDPDASAELYKTLSGLLDDGLAIVSVTHDIPAALAAATHTLELGREPFFGTIDAWMDRTSGICSICGDDIAGSHHHHGAGCRHGKHDAEEKQ